MKTVLTATGPAVTLVALTLLAGPCCAEKWEWQPRIELGYEYDDNYRLELPGNEIEVSGGVLDAQLRLLSSGQLTTWSLTPRLRTNYFPDEPQEESDDYSVNYEFQHTGQKLQTNVLARFEDESVVRSEFPTELPGEGPDPTLGEGGGSDAGRVTVRNRRQLASFSPSLRYTLNPRRGFEAGARYVNVDFDETAVEQVGYADYGIYGGVSFAQSPRTNLILRALIDRYDPETLSNEATAYGVQAEWSTQATQTTRTYLRVGGQRTQIDRVSFLGTRTESQTNYIAGAGGVWTGQRHNLLIDATHNIGPTASGFVVERDQLRVRFLRRLTERADFVAGVRGIRDAAIDDDVGYATRVYANGHVGFQWRMKRQLALGVGYNYTWQDFDDEPAARKSQGAFVSFAYEPKRRD